MTCGKHKAITTVVLETIYFGMTWIGNSENDVVIT